MGFDPVDLETGILEDRVESLSDEKYQLWVFLWRSLGKKKELCFFVVCEKVDSGVSGKCEVLYF
jgi:hypothetical protein